LYDSNTAKSQAKNADFFRRAHGATHGHDERLQVVLDVVDAWDDLSESVKDRLAREVAKITREV
jgi:hypothetical protein